MKKLVLGLVAMAGVSFVVYAACTDKVINSSSDDAANATNCADSNSVSQCTYTLMDPAKPECTSGGSGLCITSTNKIDVVSQQYTGTCNGSGGCHGGSPSAGAAPTTNSVATINLGTCG